MVLPRLPPSKGFSWHQQENPNLEPQTKSRILSPPTSPIPLASLQILEHAKCSSSSDLPTCSPHAWLLLNLQAQLKCPLLGEVASWWALYPLSYFLLHCAVDCLHGMYPNLYHLASELVFWLIS